MRLTSNLKNVYVVADAELELELEADLELEEVNGDLGIVLVDGLDLDGCK